MYMGVVVAQTQTQTQTGWEEIKQDICVAGGGYCSYPYPRHSVPKLTPAPKGYKPFYISHYGRHGSRWLHAASQYSVPVEQMTKAERKGCLTPRGKEVLSQLRQILAQSQGRIGELTPVGARQHSEIARRMTRNFPEVFQGDGVIDCKSSTVMRCALSMMNEVKEIQAYNPKLQIHADASGADMWYMVYGDQRAAELEARANQHEMRDFRLKHTHAEHLLKQLFTDEQFVRDSLDVENFYTTFCNVAANQQSHDTEVMFWDLFDEQELYDMWLCDNAFWYVVRGASPISEGHMPHLAENLLRNVIESADAFIAKGGNGANLRFGHDSCLMPLAVLMEVGNCGMVVDDLEQLEPSGWKMHRITPMAGNLQLVFYRSKRQPEDILVKALLCEEEVSLPVHTDTYPYYKWSDVRAYYLNNAFTGK